MNATWTHTALHNFKATTGAKDNAGSRHANIVEEQVAVAMGRIVVAID